MSPLQAKYQIIHKCYVHIKIFGPTNDTYSPTFIPQIIKIVNPS